MATESAAGSDDASESDASGSGASGDGASAGDASGDGASAGDASGSGESATDACAVETPRGRPCPVCGASMRHRHCKYVCPEHGVVYDCSDTFY